MSSTDRLTLAGVVDSLSVAASADGSVLIAAATSNFIGRWWTGSIAVAAREPSSDCFQLAAESALRAGVAAVDWLPAPEGRGPLQLVSGSDDGSVDVWRCEQGKTQLRHEHGSVAHDDLARRSAWSSMEPSGSWKPVWPAAGLFVKLHAGDAFPIGFATSHKY